MIKAIFADFYGTIVHEDGDIIEKVTQIICDTGKVENRSDIDSYWWEVFQDKCKNSYGDVFETQRRLETESLQETLDHFYSDADADELSELLFSHWLKPPIFEDSKEFFEKSPVPIYIVSNVDRNDILGAIAYHGLTPAAVFTSEDAKSYKPRREIFDLAMRETGLKPEEIIHIGDSLNSDVKGAGSAGIHALWLNRFGKKIPDGVDSVSSLPEAFKYIK